MLKQRISAGVGSKGDDKGGRGELGCGGLCCALLLDLTCCERFGIYLLCMLRMRLEITRRRQGEHNSRQQTSGRKNRRTGRGERERERDGWGAWLGQGTEIAAEAQQQLWPVGNFVKFVELPPAKQCELCVRVCVLSSTPVAHMWIICALTCVLIYSVAHTPSSKVGHIANSPTTHCLGSSCNKLHSKKAIYPLLPLPHPLPGLLLMRRTCCHAYEWAWAECGLNCSLSLALCCACCACRLAEFDCQVALPAATLLSATTRRKCARINMREKNKQRREGLRDKKRTLPNSFQRFSKQSAATWKIPL